MSDSHHPEHHHGPGFQAYMVVFLALSVFTAISFLVNATVGRNLTGLVIILAVAVIVLACSACYTTVAQATKSHVPSMRPWWCHSELMPGDPGSQWYLDHG